MDEQPKRPPWLKVLQAVYSPSARLSASQRTLLGALWRHASVECTCYPKDPKLVSETGLSTATLKRVRTSLREAELLTWVPGRGRGGANLYLLDPEALLALLDGGEEKIAHSEPEVAHDEPFEEGVAHSEPEVAHSEPENSSQGATRTEENPNEVIQEAKSAGGAGLNGFSFMLDTGQGPHTVPDELAGELARRCPEGQLQPVVSLIALRRYPNPAAAEAAVRKAIETLDGPRPP